MIEIFSECVQEVGCSVKKVRYKKRRWLHRVIYILKYLQISLCHNIFLKRYSRKMTEMFG